MAKTQKNDDKLQLSSAPDYFPMEAVKDLVREEVSSQHKKF